MKKKKMIFFFLICLKLFLIFILLILWKYLGKLRNAEIIKNVDKCVFCEINKNKSNEILFEKENVCLIEDKYPDAEYHYLVVIYYFHFHIFSIYFFKKKDPQETQKV